MPSINQDFQQRLILDDQEKIKLIVMGCSAVVIFILWNMPVLKYLLLPFKLLVTGLHEFSHAAVGICTGAKIKAIQIDQDTGGSTTMAGGIRWLTLPAGYIGSSLFGGLFIFSAFNLLASKIVVCVVGAAFLVILYYASGWIARIIGVFYIGLLFLFWFVADSVALPYFVLVLGVMASLQSLWDFQSLVLGREQKESDPAKYAELCGCLPTQAWAFIWFVISLVLMAGFTFLGIIAFK